jgi:glycine hydroxymethyltransferase
MLEPIAETDPVLWEAMLGERRRQHDKIELIASENYTSAAVMEAQGSWLTNKYAEGLPGKRYYGGCEYVDVADTLAQERALELFPGAEHVNVQPHSGAQANMAAYFSVLEPGDRILGMKLDQGGHLTHGMKLNFSGRLYEVHAYGVRQDTERIDYDALEVQARDVRPKLIVAGASAYPRIIDFERMAAIAHGVGALLFVDMAHIAGLVAANVHPRRSTPTSSRRRPTRPLRPARRPDLQPRRAPPAVDPATFPTVRRLSSADRSTRPSSRVQGGPLMPHDRRQAVAFGSRWATSSGATSGGHRERRDPRGEPSAGAARVVSGRDRQPPHARRRDAPRRDGPRGRGRCLDEVGITVNKRQIPFDSQRRARRQASRVGTPAVTSRGDGRR